MFLMHMQSNKPLDHINVHMIVDMNVDMNFHVNVHMGHWLEEVDAH